MGYNPISGESYSTKDGLNAKLEQLDIKDNGKQSDDTVKTPEQEDKSDDNSTTNGNDQEQATVDKPANGHSNGTNGHSNTKVRRIKFMICLLFLHQLIPMIEFSAL